VSVEETHELINWPELLAEFESYQTDEELRRVDANIFERSLLDPPPEFVAVFITSKLDQSVGRAEAIRSLYGFLLKKRYEERLNLLHFAFRIFDDDTALPEEIINRTPLPHEDGIPKFKHFSEPGFRLNPTGEAH